MRDSIVKLWNQWDDKSLQQIAAGNLFLDQKIEARHQEVERLQKNLGACRTPEPIEPENLLRGRFRMPCERGAVDAIFTLAPTMPPTVQYLYFNEARDLDAKMRAAAEGLLAKRTDVCKISKVLSSDGEKSARLKTRLRPGAPWNSATGSTGTAR